MSLNVSACVSGIVSRHLGQTLIFRRSRCGCNEVSFAVGKVKTEYSRDSVPLDPALRSISTPEGWLFANNAARLLWPERLLNVGDILLRGLRLIEIGIDGDHLAEMLQGRIEVGRAVGRQRFVHVR